MDSAFIEHGLVVALLIGVITFAYAFFAERKRAERRRRLFELSWDMQVIAGLDGIVREASPSFFRATGYTREGTPFRSAPVAQPVCAGGSPSSVWWRHAFAGCAH